MTKAQISIQSLLAFLLVVGMSGAVLALNATLNSSQGSEVGKLGIPEISGNSTQNSGNYEFSSLAPSNSTGNLTTTKIKLSREPLLDLLVDYPGKVVRGERFEVWIKVTNTGDREAKNVKVELLLPRGFEANITGFTCGTIAPGDSCGFTVGILPGQEARPGENYGRVVVKYE